MANFAFVLSGASGEYFMWAAHDDLRSANYIATLLPALISSPNATLAFSEVARFSENCPVESAQPVDYWFESKGLSYRQRLVQTILSAGPEYYGLIRTATVNEYPWYPLDYAPDIPLLIYLNLRGDFVYVPGATFRQWYPALGKSPKERARANSYRSLRPLHNVRLCWWSAAAAVAAQAKSGTHRNQLLAFVVLYSTLRNSILLTIAYEHSPVVLRRSWARWKRLWSIPAAGLGAGQRRRIRWLKLSSLPEEQE